MGSKKKASPQGMFIKTWAISIYTFAHILVSTGIYFQQHQHHGRIAALEQTVQAEVQAIVILNQNQQLLENQVATLQKRVDVLDPVAKAQR
jgi:hypothetical protein